MRAESNFIKILGIDEQELKTRLAFFELDDEDFKRLASLKDFAKKYTEEVTEAPRADLGPP